MFIDLAQDQALSVLLLSIPFAFRMPELQADVSLEELPPLPQRDLHRMRRESAIGIAGVMSAIVACTVGTHIGIFLMDDELSTRVTRIFQGCL